MKSNPSKDWFIMTDKKDNAYKNSTDKLNDDLPGVKNPTTANKMQNKHRGRRNIAINLPTLKIDGSKAKLMNDTITRNSSNPKIIIHTGHNSPEV